MKKWMIVVGIVAVLLALPSVLVSLAAEKSEAEKLVGKPAPPLKLNLLDGKKINLEDHKKSKDIVVLDFWATWCPPCRTALPILVEVTKAYKDKHVVFYAVNLREEDDKVRAFVKKSKTPFNVLMDREGVAGNAYKARSIPQGVIIDEQGIIRKVHIGVSPDLKATLKKELDELIAARDANDTKAPANASAAPAEGKISAETAAAPAGGKISAETAPAPAGGKMTTIAAPGGPEAKGWDGQTLRGRGDK